MSGSDNSGVAESVGGVAVWFATLLPCTHIGVQGWCFWIRSSFPSGRPVVDLVIDSLDPWTPRCW